MHWFLLGYLLMEEEYKQDECSTYVSGFGLPQFYTPKWIDRIVKKYGIYEDLWPCMVGLFVGLLPLFISLLFFHILGIF